MLRYALHRKGVDLAQVRGIDAGGTDSMLAAFRRGEGDFFHEQGALSPAARTGRDRPRRRVGR